MIGSFPVGPWQAAQAFTEYSFLPSAAAAPALTASNNIAVKNVLISQRREVGGDHREFLVANIEDGRLHHACVSIVSRRALDIEHLL